MNTTTTALILLFLGFIGLSFGKKCRGIGGTCTFRWNTCTYGQDDSATDDCSFYQICCLPKTKPTAAVDPNKVKCGTSIADESFRIVGGKTAELGEFPWQVGLLLDGSHWCGATLLDNNWAVTAAHCVDGHSFRRMSLVLGEHDRFYKDGVEQFVKISRIIMHPNWDDRDNENDIALMKLATPAKYTNYVRPICRPDRGEKFTGLTCVVTGWGATRENGYGPRYLQEVNVPIISLTECKRQYRYYSIFASNICAGHPSGGKDACQGDSGGPLVCRKQGENWKLAGVVSWGEGCARPNSPGVYTDVAFYDSWINSVMSKY
ncbi:trypsin-1-like [Tubulanus polymorphus]|uniref:trypsin-1-like n=1 Tax=Tubulanus polymorphus TaxID=672921 RepID=UPI003DA61F47